MCAVGVREPLEAAAIQPDAVHVAANVAALRAREIDPAARLIDAVECAKLPCAAGNLLDAGAVRLVVEQVPPPGRVAEPEKRPVLQPGRRLIFARVEGRGTLLTKDRPRSIRVAGLRDVEIEP